MQHFKGKAFPSTYITGFGLFSCEVYVFCIANIKLLEIVHLFLATFSEPLEAAPPKVENYWPRYMAKPSSLNVYLNLWMYFNILLLE